MLTPSGSAIIYCAYILWAGWFTRGCPRPNLTRAQKWASAEVLAIFTLVMLNLWVFDTHIVPWILAIAAIAGIAIADFAVRIRNIKKDLPENMDPACRNAIITERIGDCTQRLGLGRWRNHPGDGPCLEFWDFRWIWRLAKLVALALAMILIAGYFFKPEFWKTKDFWSKKIYTGTLIYIVWGTIQQFALHGCVTSKLYSIFAKSSDLQTVEKKAVYLTALCSGILFFFVHIPNPTLMIVTPIAGAVTAYVFLNCRNIFILGIAHGIIGNTIGVCLAHGLRVGWHYWN